MTRQTRSHTSSWRANMMVTVQRALIWLSDPRKLFKQLLTYNIAMARHTWRVADAGVLLWEPAVEAATAIALREPHALEQPDNVAEADVQGKWPPIILAYSVTGQGLTAYD